MAVIINGYELNQPGEAADWSTREYNFLSAVAESIPMSAGESLSTLPATGWESVNSMDIRLISHGRQVFVDYKIDGVGTSDFDTTVTLPVSADKDYCGTGVIWNASSYPTVDQGIGKVNMAAGSNIIHFFKTGIGQTGYATWGAAGKNKVVCGQFWFVRK